MDESAKHRQNFFAQVYRENLWQGRESRSGQGSEVGQVGALISGLPEVLRRHEIKSLLDVPCGDLNWMKQVDLGKISYIGGDIVSEIIEYNIENYESNLRSFKVIDISRDKLPSADMIFVRDCFIHFTNKLIFMALQNIASSSIKYLCITHDMDHERYPDGHNIDLDGADGEVHHQYRPLNFQLPPFSFPEPIDVMSEGDHRKDFGNRGIYVMAIWDMNQVRTALAARALEAAKG